MTLVYIWLALITVFLVYYHFLKEISVGIETTYHYNKVIGLWFYRNMTFKYLYFFPRRIVDKLNDEDNEKYTKELRKRMQEFELEKQRKLEENRVRHEQLKQAGLL